ncbi:MAG: hypothetical protein L3K25_11785 [Gammaproteobacteria bacterium]|nr:hypothetical protein [Gammaproteobacteria bacterium]
MKYLLLRNEKSVRDIADKAYKNLSDKARKQAEAALLKINPELKTFKSVRKGFIVRIPVIPEDSKSNRRNSIDPVENIAHEMSEKLKQFERSLDKKFVDLENRQKDFLQSLKAAGNELKKQPNGVAASKTLQKYVSDSNKLNDKNKKLSISALKKMQKTIATFDR